MNDATVSAEGLTYTADRLRATRRQLAARSVHDLAAALGSVGERFLDADDPLRTEALAALPAASGLSAPMCAAVLDGMAVDWTTERLEALVDAELGGGAALDGFVGDGPRHVMAVGPALCVQIVAGGVPGVGVTALLRCLLVKGPTLLRPGNGDTLLPTLFARALAAVDPTLAESLAVVTWPSTNAELSKVALERAEVAVVYGSDETVRAVRSLAPATTRLVEYHHRVSIGLVGRDALVPSQLDATATAVATAVAQYDQRGCVSPQIVFVEEGGARSPADFAESLARALATLETRLPSGSLDTAAAAGLQQARAAAELTTAASGSGFVRHGRAAPWTVALQSGAPATSGAAGRFLRVWPVDDAADVPALVAHLGHHLQTVGTAGLGSRTEVVARALAQIGVARVAPFASVPYPPAWWHHDGRGPLLDLVRWVDLER